MSVKILYKIILIAVLLFSLFIAKSLSAIETLEHEPDSLLSELNSNKLDSNQKGDILLEIAKHYEIYENPTQAIVYYTKADSIYSINKNKYGVTISKVGLGVNYHKQNKYDKALENFFNSLDLIPQISTDITSFELKLYQGIILHNISIIFGEVKYYEAALKYATEADFYLSNLDTLYKASSQSNLGTIYLGLRQYNEAYYHLNIAKDYFQSDMINIALKATTFKNLGTTYLSNKEYDKAQKAFIEALNLLDSQKDIYISERAAIYAQIAQAYAETNVPDSALYNLNIALKLAYKENGNRYIEEIYECMVNIYSAINNSEKTLESLQKLNQIQDSLYNHKILENITNIHRQYEQKQIIHQNEMKLRLLEQEKTIIQYRWYALFGISTIIILILLLLFFKLNYRNKLKKNELKSIKLEQEQLADKLEFKNKELTNFAMYIVKKNEVLDKIKEQITTIKASKQADPELNKIYNFITQHLDSLSDSNEFDLRIENEYQDFYYNLQKRFPDLTEKDKKLCSLLLLDLSSKDIASILNIESSSVDKSRYRLRKKMGIDSDISISSYLKSI